MVFQEEVLKIIKSKGYEAELMNGRDERLGVGFKIEKVENGPSIHAILYFDEFTHIKDVNEVADMMINIINSQATKTHSDTAASGFYRVLEDKEKALDSLILCVRPCKKEHRDGEIYRAWLDLEQYCRVDSATMSVVVNESMLEKWGVSEEEVFARAKDNSKKNEVVNMIDVVNQKAGPTNRTDLSSQTEMFFLASRTGDNGANAMCDTELLRKISIDNGKIDIIILPCSIHEVILQPYSEDLLERSHTMIREINEETVRKEERLPNHAYVYSFSKDEVIIPNRDHEPQNSQPRFA